MLFDKGDYDLALADYSKSISLKPTAAAYFGRGRTYEKMGLLSAAKADYNMALKIRAQDRGGEWAHKQAEGRLKALANSP